MVPNPRNLLLAIAVPAAAAGALAFFLYHRYKKQKKSERATGSISKEDSSLRLLRSVSSLQSIQDALKHVENFTALGFEQTIIIAMVGLPARGKSYLVKMIIRYLNWTGFHAEVFNVGSYRRQIGLAAADSTFFAEGNPDGKRVREEMAMAVQDHMYNWLREAGDSKGKVAIFDATNTTKSRRLALAKRAREENVFLLFVESICDDKDVLRRNYEMKLKNDDYKSMDPDVARKDFLSRVSAYEKVYETVEDDEDDGRISYVKLINVGQKMVLRNCSGYLPSQVAFYLQNVHIYPRRIYLSLTAQNEILYLDGSGANGVGGESSPSTLTSAHNNGFDCSGPGTADSGMLTAAGLHYADELVVFVRSQQESMTGAGHEVLVIGGTADVHTATMQPISQSFPCYNTPLLNELRGGDFHGLSRGQMKKLNPIEYEKRIQDKLRYRYPGVGGESYLDVIERLRPVIIELERQRRSVVVICHLAVLRCIYAYFMGIKLEEIPYLPFRQHVVYELTPGPFGCTCRSVSPSVKQESEKM